MFSCGTLRDEPATGKQLHTIAVLCHSLSITTPIEEQPLTIGEAGVLIRRLYSERNYRRRNNVSR